jgi:hypothetical protein
MMRRWRLAPAPIKVWIALNVAIGGVAALPGLPDFHGSVPGAVGVLVVLSALLVRGSRVVWWLLVVFTGWGLLAVWLAGVVGARPGLGFVAFLLLYTASFVALLMPSTRRWVKPGGRGPRDHRMRPASGQV